MGFHISIDRSNDDGSGKPAQLRTPVDDVEIGVAKPHRNRDVPLLNRIDRIIPPCIAF